MRFKIDENLPFEVALLFHLAGFEARTVSQQSALGTADPDLAAMCKAHEEILVTMDLDFADIRTYPPGDHPGFIVVRSDSQSKQGIIDLLRSRMVPFMELSLEHHATIVSSRNIRYYPGE